MRLCIHICVLAYVCIHVCASVCMWVHTCVHRNICIYANICKYMSADPGSSGLKEMELNVTGTEESYVAINQKLQIVASN